MSKIFPNSGAHSGLYRLISAPFAASLADCIKAAGERVSITSTAPPVPAEEEAEPESGLLGVPVASLLKLRALNVKLKTIESKVKNFKLKDYQSYTPSRLGKFY